MTNATKNKIKEAVSQYTKLFPKEFELFKLMIEDTRRERIDKFSTFAKGDDVIKRKLYEVPEILHGTLMQILEDEELNELYSKKGGRWFAKTFPVFSLTE